MKYTENALNVLTAKSYKGIGNAWIVQNLSNNEDVETIVSRLNKKIKGRTIAVQDFEQVKRKYELTINERFCECCDGFVALGDPNFPQHRGDVKDGKRPVFLYYKGEIDLLSSSNQNISVIGLLNPSEEIELRERKLVAQFIKNGATIVSGLALGCDSISHREALKSNGKTVAILPSPLTSILPTRNKELASQIVKDGGLLVTEYGKNFESKMELSARYEERDRLQALFCDTIVLVASYSQKSPEKWKVLTGQKLDSGARLAMGYADDYNIPRAVMYDKRTDAENPMFDLCRETIKKSGDESKNLTVITQDNYVGKVEEIMNNILKTQKTKPRQPALTQQYLQGFA